MQTLDCGQHKNQQVFVARIMLFIMQWDALFFLLNDKPISILKQFLKGVRSGQFKPARFSAECLPN